MKRVCKVDGCERADIKAKGYCTKHWQRIKRNGDTELRIAFRGPRKDYPREYRIWEGIHERCYQSGNTSFPRYGARGIKVCDRWNGANGFANFIADMGPATSRKHSIDRIDVNGDYSPENCRWATPLEQACNRRNNVEFPGVNYCKREGKWRARYRANGMSLSRCFSSREDAIDQRIEWLQKYPL